MHPSWKLISLLCCVSYFYVLGVLIFARGFLLTRTEITEKSSLDWRDEVPSPESALRTLEPKFRRAIIIIVDALKYDFAVYNESLVGENDCPYSRNRLPVFHRLLTQEPSKARLYQFMADPPTTTMQRLKGLTTGSLPTFIDASANFASYEITEDNLVDQLRSSGKRIIFMGDDTWVGLYPNRFTKSYPFPSFNVWDLDTVDSGIKEKLVPQVQRDDWDVIIAHFLGVDHCGHRYGPNHPEMARKLSEMNDVVTTIVQEMENDTLLVVFGDHGMTKTGDHGGDSMDEVSSVLFAYSSFVTLTPHEPSLDPSTVSQIDLVPTLSILLGIPIPFPNLGTVLLDLIFPDPTLQPNVPLWEFGSQVLLYNLRQVRGYIAAYTSWAGEQFAVKDMVKIDDGYKELMMEVEVVHDWDTFRKFAEKSRVYLEGVKNMCAAVWVQFDWTRMAVGLTLVGLTNIGVVLIVVKAPLKRLKAAGYTCLAAIMISGAVTIQLQRMQVVTSIQVPLGVTAVIIQVALLVFVLRKRKVTEKSTSFNVLAALLVLIPGLGLFSNSYVVEEASVLSFISMSCIWVHAWSLKATVEIPRSRSGDSKRRNNVDVRLSNRKTHALLGVVVLCSLLRLSHFFWRCREEQSWCEPSDIHKPLSAIPSSVHMYKSWRYFCTLMTLALFVTVYRMWWRGCGNLNGFTLPVIVARYSCPIIVVLISAYWALLGFHAGLDGRAGLWQTYTFAQAAAAIVGLSILSIVIHPLCVYVLPENTKDELGPIYSPEAKIPSVYSYLKANWEKHFTKEKVASGGNSMPVVYGLGTACSAAVLVMAVLVTLLLCLLLGDGMAMSAVLALVSLTLFLELTSIVRAEKVCTVGQLFRVPWNSVLCWGLLSSYFFYGTGHQPTFPAIPWDAAFVGTFTSSAISQVPSAVAVILHLFTSHILFGITLPLLLVFPATNHVMFPKLGFSEEVVSVIGGAHVRKGELFLLWEKDDCVEGWFDLAAKYLAVHGFKLMCSMVAAAIHCRHLMVWKIFAPRFIFEGLAMLVTVPSVLIGFLFALRISCALEEFMKGLKVGGNSPS